MTDDTNLLGLHRLRERIAGIAQARGAEPTPMLDAYLRGMRDAEALVAPDYEADDAAEEPEEEELVWSREPEEPEPPTLRNAEPPPEKKPPIPVWTPERDAELLRLSADSVSPMTILARLNAMPGIPIASVKALKNRRHALRLAEPGSAAQPFGGCSAEDWAEAIELRRAGKGGRDICEEYGWPLNRAGVICAALDRAIGKGSAA